MTKTIFALAALAAIGFSGAAFAEEATTPKAMTDAEMDGVTAGISISFLTDTDFGTFPGPRPDDVLASVDLGFNTILWHNTYLNMTGQFGLSGDIPDFRLITSVPVRF